MDVALIEVPYHLGHERVGTGLGPGGLVQAGAVDLLREAGRDVEIERVRRREEQADEIGEGFRIRPAVVTAYDPARDPEGRIPPTAIRLMTAIAAAAARPVEAAAG